MLTRRLQVLLDEDRYRRLETTARRRGLSVAAVVREAIDRGLDLPEMDRRTAGRSFLDAPVMPVGELDETLAELEELRGRRG